VVVTLHELSGIDGCDLQWQATARVDGWGQHHAGRLRQHHLR